MHFQMGYGHFSQRGKGLHLRQYSRAFIIDDNVKRAAFVSVDGAMVAHTIKRDVSKPHTQTTLKNAFTIRFE